MIAFIKKEKSPIVTKLRGNEIKFNIGFTIKKSKDNANPPAIKVNTPP